MRPVFFYGLFMDMDFLKGKGFAPTTSTLAYADGFGLRHMRYLSRRSPARLVCHLHMRQKSSPGPSNTQIEFLQHQNNFDS